MLRGLIRGAILLAIGVLIWKHPQSVADKGGEFVAAAFSLLGSGWDSFMEFVEGL